MRISVIQMSPGSIKADNIAQAQRLIDACVDGDRPDLIVLPEVWTCLGGDRDTRVAAAGTVGTHHDGAGRPYQTYGHSMVIDPWGTVTARASSGTGWATGRLDGERTRRIRADMPVMDHRRLP